MFWCAQNSSAVAARVLYKDVPLNLVYDSDGEYLSALAVTVYATVITNNSLKEVKRSQKGV